MKTKLQFFSDNYGIFCNLLHIELPNNGSVRPTNIDIDDTIFYYRYCGVNKRSFKDNYVLDIKTSTDGYYIKYNIPTQEDLDRIENIKLLFKLIKEGRTISEIKFKITEDQLLYLKLKLL